MATLKPRLLLLALLMVMAVYISLPTLMAQQPDQTPTSTPAHSTLLVADAFVRGGPGEGYIPVGRVIPSTQLTALNISEDGS